MSILNLAAGSGLVGLIKGWGTEGVGRVSGVAATARPIEIPVRRLRAAAVTHVREADRFEEDCERWDGLA